MKKGSSKSKQNPEPQTPRRRKYDEEFKRQAVAMVRNGQPVRTVAQALGISENVLHRWRRDAMHNNRATDEINNLLVFIIISFVGFAQTRGFYRRHYWRST